MNIVLAKTETELKKRYINFILDLNHRTMEVNTHGGQGNPWPMGRRPSSNLPQHLPCKGIMVGQGPADERMRLAWVSGGGEEFKGLEGSESEVLLLLCA